MHYLCSSLASTQFLNFILAAQKNYFITDGESKNYCSDLGIGCQIIHDSQKRKAVFVWFVYLNYTAGSKGITACILQSTHLSRDAWYSPYRVTLWTKMLKTQMLKHRLNLCKSFQITLERKQNQCTSIRRKLPHLEGNLPNRTLKLGAVHPWSCAIVS